jgi:hypothetical protein
VKTGRKDTAMPGATTQCGMLVADFGLGNCDVGSQILQFLDATWNPVQNSERSSGAALGPATATP